MATTRNTIQRQLVLQTVREMRNHPTAEEIYERLTKEHPHISKATIYRNLGMLADNGEIQRVSHLNAADRFDFELKPHYHFRCTGCGCVYDIDLPYMQNLLEEVPNEEGFILEGYEITFTGLCKNCKQSRGTVC